MKTPSREVNQDHVSYTNKNISARVNRPNRKSAPYIKIVTCLSIGEYTSVVSLKRIIKDIPPEAVKDVLLRGIVGQFWIQREETMIKSERLRLFPEIKK